MTFVVWQRSALSVDRFSRLPRRSGGGANIHRGQASVDRLRDAHDNAHLIHLPIHASWLNQVEIYFSVVQRKVLTPNDFADLDQIEARLLAFQGYHEHIATPFEWKFTTNDLHALLARTATHDELAQAA